MSKALSTRERIINAFLNLIKYKSLSSLTVVAITKEAGVSHQTFYRLFLDKYHLAESICLDNFNIFITLYGDNAALEDIIMCILNIIKNNPAFYQRLLNDELGTDVFLKSVLKISGIYTGSTASVGSVHNWIRILKEWSSANFSQGVQDIYRKLLMSMSVSDILIDEELENALIKFGRLRISDYKDRLY